MQRPLGSFETAAALSHDYAPFVVVLAAELVGRGPDPERLGEVLASLQERHPLLRVRIVESRDGYRYEDGVPPIPLSVLERTSDEQWREAVESELNRRLEDRTGPLARCVYLPPADETGRCEVILTCHHAIIDAVSCISLLDELLGASAGRAFAETASAVSTLSPEERLPARARGLSGAARRLPFMLRALADEAAYRIRTGRARPAVPASTKCRILPRALSAEETTSLVQATRRRGVTLPAVLNAAFLLCVARHLHGGRGGPLRYMSFADLRPYLEPSVSAGELGSHITMLRHTIGVDGSDLWSLARRITDQVHEALRRGDRLVSAALCDTMMRLALGQREHRMATVGVSYSGAARLRRSYGDMQLAGVHGFISNFDLGPELAAQVKLLWGELVVDIVYLDAELERSSAEALAGEILEMLRRGGGATSR